MKICDLCRQVTGRLHLGPKGTEKTEVCDPCNNDLMARITKLQREEAAMREARWATMIEDYRREYNQRRPHSRLGYHSPARFAAQLTPSPSAVGLRPPSVGDGQTQNPSAK